MTVTRDSTLVEEYRYDANGNRIFEINTDLNINDRTLHWSVEDHIIDAGNITYEFDFDDNLAARIDDTGTTEYQYSSTGELMQVTLPDNTLIEYVHDPLGRRIAKKVNGNIVEKYLWNGRTTLLAVYDGNDTLLQRFEYADGRVPVAMSMNGSIYYLAYDQIGTLRLVFDSSGTVVKRIDYDTFGNIIMDSNPSLNVPFGFAGGLHDRDTGLVRFGYRDYMPEIGKWTAKDPILFAGGDSNLYGYVSNDPVNFVDPWGLWSEYGEITNPPGFVDSAIASVKTDAYNIVNNPHPNARADAVMKYVSYTVGTATGLAGVQKAAMLYPGAAVATHDFIFGLVPGAPQGAGYISAGTLWAIELYRSLMDRLDKQSKEPCP